MLMTFSGMDGAGKTTQIELLKQSLENEHKTYYYFWSRGGYTPGFNVLKKIIRLALGRKLPESGRSQSRAETLSKPSVSRVWLFIAILDLILFYGLVLRIKKITHDFVICDRYLDDTRLDFTLNFPGIDLEKSIIWRILKSVTPQPDYSFLFVVPVEESIKRSKQKNEPFPDDESVLKKRLTAFNDNAFFPRQQYNRINGCDDISVIEKDIFYRVMPGRRTGRNDEA